MADDTSFAAPTGIQWNGNVGVVEYGGNDKMVVMFYNKPMHNPQKSAEAGRPIYDDKVFVRIHPPGERLNIIDRPAEGQHQRKYPVQWAQFQQQKQQIPEGTPIDMLYPEHPSIGASLRAYGIHTIEQCAELSANAIENLHMGGQKYVNAAQAYLKAAHKGVHATEFRKTIEDLEQKNKILARQVEQLKASLDKMVDGQMNNQINADQLQQIIAGALQRPVHLPQHGFDPAMAQLNATHGSVGGPKPQPRRQRARVG